MIKVLIVEDSPVIAEFLKGVLETDPDVTVVGIVAAGEQALDAVTRTRPDVITMDFHLPGINGLDATRTIMEVQPTPIVIVSGSTAPDEITRTFRAVEAGALAVLPRPRGLDDPDYERSAQEFVTTVKLMSEVKVVKRWPPRAQRGAVSPHLRLPRVAATTTPVQVVALGASTGGPMVLETLLARLPPDFPAPLLIVQHIAPGFVLGFAEWLTQATGFPVRVAQPGEHALPGRAYVAPDGFQMGVGLGPRIVLKQDVPENELRPSVSYLFRSVAEVYGRKAVGVLLTGMGKDGAAELKLMKERGATTLVQDPETAVVAGMPAEAIRLEAATYVLSPDDIATMLTTLARGQAASKDDDERRR